jgi:hypothetical protein
MRLDTGGDPGPSGQTQSTCQETGGHTGPSGQGMCPDTGGPKPKVPILTFQQISRVMNSALTGDESIFKEVIEKVPYHAKRYRDSFFTYLSKSELKHPEFAFSSSG